MLRFYFENISWTLGEMSEMAVYLSNQLSVYLPTNQSSQ